MTIAKEEKIAPSRIIWCIETQRSKVESDFFLLEERRLRPKIYQCAVGVEGCSTFVWIVVADASSIKIDELVVFRKTYDAKPCPLKLRDAIKSGKTPGRFKEKKR